MMLSQSTIGLVLAVASLVSAQPTELTARAQVTYPEATAFKEPMADGRCGGSELGTANMHDGHQRSESFMGMANFGKHSPAALSGWKERRDSTGNE